MVVFCRDLTLGFDKPGLTTSAVLTEARAIVAELPRPVDPDLLEAKKVAVVNSRWEPDSAQAIAVMAGKQDHIPMVRCALAAIKRGRELAQEGK